MNIDLGCAIIIYRKKRNIDLLERVKKLLNNNIIKIENDKDEINKLFNKLNELYKRDGYAIKQLKRGMLTRNEVTVLYWQRLTDKIDLVNKINAKRWEVAVLTSRTNDLTNEQISLSINADKNFCFLSDCDQMMTRTYSKLLKYFMSKQDQYLDDESVRYANEALDMYCLNNHDFRKHIEKVVNDYAKCKYVTKKAFLKKEQLNSLYALFSKLS